MHNEIDMPGEGQKELQLNESQRELAGQIFQNAKNLVQRFGEPSTWGERLPKEVVYLDVEDAEDRRGKNRIVVWGDSDGDEVVIFYNKNYSQGVYLNNQVTLRDGRVLRHNADIEEWHGDSPIINPPWQRLPTPEMVQVMGSRFHPLEVFHGQLNLNEIARFITEGEVVTKPKKDRIIQEFIKRLDEVETERVFGKPEEAAKKAKEIWSEEAIIRDLEQLKRIPEDDRQETAEKLALVYVDAAFKELSAINSLAHDTQDLETRRTILDRAREAIKREKKFHILAKQLAKTATGESVDWSKVKLREYGRMYERHETQEYWQLAKLIYSEVIELAKRDGDLGTQAAATMELARVTEKLGSDATEIDNLYSTAHRLNWVSRNDKNYNRQVTIEGNILRRNLSRRDIGATLGSLKNISWIVLHDPKQAVVLGKKVLGG